MAVGRTVTLPADHRDALLATLLGATPAEASAPGPVRITPLVARGTVLGMVVYLRRNDREAFDYEDATLGDELAARAAVAIDNARLYLREHQTLLARQQALQQANATRRRLALVNEASTRIGTTLDLQRTALELAQVATQGLADAVVVEVLEELVHGNGTEGADPAAARAGPPTAPPTCADSPSTPSRARAWNRSPRSAACTASTPPPPSPGAWPIAVPCWCPISTTARCIGSTRSPSGSTRSGGTGCTPS